MFKRKLETDLNKWRKRPGRKPLVLRGARQVGKTSLINEFGKQYKQYINLNLESKADRRLFTEYTDFNTLVQQIFFNHNKVLAGKNDTLIFIDEIQEVPEALQALRFFYEQYPEISVIAAGSMLESLFLKDVSFPVGRVEFLVLRPFSFSEFLEASGEQAALEHLSIIPTADFAHEKLLSLFHEYVLIGGMPEVISHYINNKDVVALSEVYESLIASYLEDAEKYSKSDAQTLHIRHVVSNMFGYAGKRIKFEGFGNSSYKSRDMGDALRLIEKAFLIHLVYPVTATQMPVVQNVSKSPRLHVLDTGLLNYFSGIQKEILGSSDISSAYRGLVAEHIVGQEMLSFQNKPLSKLLFWTREKNTSMAEVDYLFPYKGNLIPIEVKSGGEGKLKSLHLFMDDCWHDIAIRYYGGKPAFNNVKTKVGKEFRLLSLPYYSVSVIEKYLEQIEVLPWKM